MNKELRGTTKVELHQANSRLADDCNKLTVRASILAGQAVLARREIEAVLMHAEIPHTGVILDEVNKERLSRAYRILSGG